MLLKFFFRCVMVVCRLLWFLFVMCMVLFWMLVWILSLLFFSEVMIFLVSVVLMFFLIL